VFAALADQLLVLQIVQHAKFEEMAENNHQRTLALRAPRGVLYDRNGQVLVENRHSFTISIVREHTKDLDRTIGCCPRSPGSTRRRRPIVARHRGEPTTGRSWSSRTPRWRRSRRITRGGSIRAARRRGRRSTDATVPRGRHRRTLVRLRRRGQ
jgi:hypothetical protein